MNFRTPITKIEFPFTLTHRDKICLLGSCFTENIGKELLERKFHALVNPFGIIYNPISLSKAINRGFYNHAVEEKDVFQHRDLYVHFDFHGSFSAPEKDQVVSEINSSIQKGHDFFGDMDFLFLSFGSAFAFRHIASDEIVTNCHKIPAKNFERVLLEEEKMLNEISMSLDLLIKQNPALQIILTVSPVRHLRDGLIQNNLSKALLIKLSHNLCHQFSNVHYFPSYEIVMDDLRDYRFYAEDLTHPNNLAIQYIWDYFSDCFFDKTTQNLNKLIEQFRSSLNHRPLYQKSDSHKVFLSLLKERISEFNKQNPFVDLDEELKEIDKRVNQIK